MPHFCRPRRRIEKAGEALRSCTCLGYYLLMTELMVSAALIGFWSSGHCLAMCGGLAIAAGEAQRRVVTARGSQQALELFCWQLGRIASYGLLGLIAGGFGALVLSSIPVKLLREIIFIAVNLLLIGLGLHVARLYGGILVIERFGQKVWRLIAPLAATTLLPRTQPPYRLSRQILSALRAGMVWGWLPCGLVYSMLMTASVSGGPIQGALWMIGFGAGTISSLWLASTLSYSTLSRLQSPFLRRLAGLFIAGFGLWGLLRIAGVIHLDWLDAFCIGGQGFRNTP
jgi:sulfite exporter TauE/SafE